MELQEKFKQGKSRHTYKRIDGEYKVNIFLGYNDNGNMSMVLTEPGQIVKVKSSQMIDVKLRRRDDGKIALSFDLLDQTFEPMFLIFCRDIIVVCEHAGREQALSRAIIRWKYWKELFGRKRSQILEKNEIKGLIGELIELRDHFIPEFGSRDAVKCWMGPLLGHKDFELIDTWYETKTINEGAIQVIISSLEQLDSDVDGHLVIVRLEETSPITKNSFDLNQIVAQVMDMISDPEDLDAFRIKLDNVGYVPDAEYENYKFVHKGTKTYKVSEQFPRITRKNVKASIGNVKYTILLDGISNFVED